MRDNGNGSAAIMHHPAGDVPTEDARLDDAIRRGGRVPVPLVGPEWAVARGLTYVSGAPLPEHVLEMLHRGRLADNSRAREVLRFRPGASTRDVIDQLYRWPSIIHTPARRQVA